MRFLAAFLVVLYHARPEHWVAWSALDAASQGIPAGMFFLLIRPGPEAVVVFFVLSGYLVGGQVLRRCLDGSFCASDYFISRASRIFTPFIPALLFTLGCVIFLHGAPPPGIGWQALGNLLQLQGILCQPLEGNPPFWSLSYEVWFYVLAGAAGLAWSLHRTKIPAKWPGMTLAVALLLFASGCLLLLKTHFLACWLFGALAFIFPIKLIGKSVWFTSILGTLLGVMLCQATNPAQGGLVTNSPLLYQAGTLLLAASIAGGLACLKQQKYQLPKGRLQLIAPRLAAFSYTLYLTHYPLLLVMRGWHSPYATFSLPSLALYFIKIAVCVLAAWLLYLLFESHTPRIGRSIKGWFPKVSCASLSSVHE